MPILRHFAIIVLVIFLLSFITVNATNTATVSEEYPGFIPITHAPCCLECSYSLPYCYYYNISNMNDGIKVVEWNLDNGWINGRAIANIDANLIVKMCFQLSLTAAYILMDEEFDLEAEFDFKVKLTSDDNLKNQCIDKAESIVNYSSFVLKGDLSSDPVPEIGFQLVDDIKSVIKHSICKTAYDSLNGGLSPEGGENENIYCHQSQDDSEAIESPCPCY
ncbi:hypothetical protein ACFL1N_08265 [Thermodesulfobacteriota bacterium]